MTNILTLLKEMNLEQKQALVKILGLKKTDDLEIASKISKILLPAKGWLQEPMTYQQFITSIAEKNNESTDFSKGIVHAERELYLKLFQNEFEKLSQYEKDKILAALDKVGLNKNQITSLSGIGALGAAQLSGFGIYILASSTVGAITSLLGITLPFAMYTGMSSAISFIIGPVGFLVMGVMMYRSFKHVKTWDQAVEILEASWKEMGTLVRGDFSRGTQIFKYIAASRIILETNFTKEIEEIKIERENFTRKTTEIQDRLELKKEERKVIQNSEGQKKDDIYRIENEIREKHRQIDRINIEIEDVKEKLKSFEELQSDLNLEIQQKKSEILKKEKDSQILNEKIKNITE